MSKIVVETRTDEGNTPEFGVSLLLVDDSGSSGVGLTLQRAGPSGAGGSG